MSLDSNFNSRISEKSYSIKEFARLHLKWSGYVKHIHLLPTVKSCDPSCIKVHYFSQL